MAAKQKGGQLPHLPPPPDPSLILVAQQRKLVMKKSKLIRFLTKNLDIENTVVVSLAVKRNMYDVIS